MYNQLYLFLGEKKMLYINLYQFGSRKGYRLYWRRYSENLNSAIDNKQITCGLLLDLSRAFNAVTHDILLSKLCTYGICGTPFKWFKS